MLLRREDLELQKRYYLPILKESIFIHPTDTVYSIGCNATNNLLVMKLRVLKQWQAYPFTIIAPSIEWIRENLDVPEEALNQLPGSVTIIAHLKNPQCVAEQVHLGHSAIGVRLPEHWISSITAQLGIPIVSTCANKQAECLMTSLDDADPHLIAASAVIIHEGIKKGRPTVFIDYTEGSYWITS